MTLLAAPKNRKIAKKAYDSYHMTNNKMGNNSKNNCFHSVQTKSDITCLDGQEMISI